MYAAGLKELTKNCVIFSRSVEGINMPNDTTEEGFIVGRDMRMADERFIS
jgi:hypothetical protein